MDVEEETLKVLLEFLKQSLEAAQILLDKAGKDPALEHEVARLRERTKEMEQAIVEN